MSALLLTLASVAFAQDFGQARLVDGTPDFRGCIEGGGSCQTDFFRFLTHSMMEQGFTLQNHPVATSTLTERRLGWTVGGQLATFPFAAPRKNLSGKAENTSFSPVYPRVFAGWRGGEDDGRQHGLGVSLLPPVPVQGASAMTAGVDGSISWGGASRWGVEGDFTWVRVRAPIVATEDQLADRDNWSNPDNLDPDQFDAVCGEDVADGAGGCIDRYGLYNLGLRAAVSQALGGGWVPCAKLGVNIVNERMYVKYDDTTWHVFALQPAAHAGVAWNAGDHLFLAAGGSAAYQQANQDEEGQAGVFTKLEGSAAWAF